MDVALGQWIYNPNERANTAHGFLDRPDCPLVEKYCAGMLHPTAHGVTTGKGISQDGKEPADIHLDPPEPGPALLTEETYCSLIICNSLQTQAL